MHQPWVPSLWASECISRGREFPWWHSETSVSRIDAHFSRSRVRFCVSTIIFSGAGRRFDSMRIHFFYAGMKLQVAGSISSSAFLFCWSQVQCCRSTFSSFHIVANSIGVHLCTIIFIQVQVYFIYIKVNKVAGMHHVPHFWAPGPSHIILGMTALVNIILDIF